MRTRYNKQHNHSSRKGFTLAEVLVSVALMAFVATAAIGSMVVLNHVRATLDKQAKANMVMVATVSYLRADLNNCSNPDDMDCSTYYPIDNNDENKYGPVFYTFSSTNRYVNFKIRNKSDSFASGMVTEPTTGQNPVVQYWNSPYGICVGIKYGVKPSDKNGIKAPLKNRKYVIAQNVMEGTNMYTLIGNDKLNVGDIYSKGSDPSFKELIDYNEKTKLFTFWVYVLDKNTNEVIMKQKVEVCPDTFMPNYNP